jgi:hypothetical protein
MISMPFYTISFFVVPLLLPIFTASLIVGLISGALIYRYIFASILIIVILSSLLMKGMYKLFIELEYSLLRAIYEIFITKKDHAKIERVESTRRS